MPPVIAAKATPVPSQGGLKAGPWFRRGPFAMLSPGHVSRRRVEAEFPLIKVVQNCRGSVDFMDKVMENGLNTSSIHFGYFLTDKGRLSMHSRQMFRTSVRSLGLSAALIGALASSAFADSTLNVTDDTFTDDQNPFQPMGANPGIHIGTASGHQ
ncbi:MAG: hypothetical protein ACREDA_05505, partial [Methylocella sp.]